MHHQLSVLSSRLLRSGRTPTHDQLSEFQQLETAFVPKRAGGLLVCSSKFQGAVLCALNDHREHRIINTSMCQKPCVTQKCILGIDLYSYVVSYLWFQNSLKPNYMSSFKVFQVPTLDMGACCPKVYLPEVSLPPLDDPEAESWGDDGLMSKAL